MTDAVDKVKLFNTEFINIDRSGACDLLESAIQKKEKFLYAAVKDVALTVRSLESGFLRNFYGQSDYMFVDGKGILYASRLLGRPLKDMVGGPGLFNELLERANHKGYRIFLLGARPSVLETAVLHIKKRLPHIHIVGSHDGYFNLEESGAVVDAINDSQPDILFIGMSTPHRERFVERHRRRFASFLCLPVGGVFDNEAGVTRYAPKPIAMLGLEWLYRALQEPRRLMKRYLSTHLKFVWYFLKELLNGSRTFDDGKSESP